MTYEYPTGDPSREPADLSDLSTYLDDMMTLWEREYDAGHDRSAKDLWPECPDDLFSEWDNRIRQRRIFKRLATSLLDDVALAKSTKDSILEALRDWQDWYEAGIILPSKKLRDLLPDGSTAVICDIWLSRLRTLHKVPANSDELTYDSEYIDELTSLWETYNDVGHDRWADDIWPECPHELLSKWRDRIRRRRGFKIIEARVLEEDTLTAATKALVLNALGSWQVAYEHHDDPAPSPDWVSPEFPDHTAQVGFKIWLARLRKLHEAAAKVDGLLNEWESRADQGEDCSAEDICPEDAPQHVVAEIAHQIAKRREIRQYDIEEMLDRFLELHEDSSEPTPAVEDLFPACPPTILEELKARIANMLDDRVPFDFDSLLHLNGDQSDPASAYLSRLKKGFRPIPGANYELIDRLDDEQNPSGFGQVWKAMDSNSTRKPFAVFKFCKAPWDNKARTTFENEFRLVHGLDHPGIVKLEAGYLRLPVPVLQYEFVEGVDLSKVLADIFQDANHKGLTAEHAAAVILKLSDIVAFVHAQQPRPIVHRDLKPANILVANSQPVSALRALGTPDLRSTTFKILDFGIGGLARYGERSTTAYQSRGREMEGFQSRLYASPEQDRGDPADPADDVFSLGVIWYQLLVGDLEERPPSGRLNDLEEKGMTEEQIAVLEGCFRARQRHIPFRARQRRIPNAIDLAKAIRRVYQDVSAVAIFSEAMDAALAQFKNESLSLKGSTQLSQEAAKALIQWPGIAHKAALRSLSVLTELSPEIAAALAHWEGTGLEDDFQLSFDGLTELTPETAAALAHWDVQWGELLLNGLTELSPETAAALAKWDGFALHLNGVTELSPETAAALAKWNGSALHLNGLTSLSPKTAAALAVREGDLMSLDGLKELSLEAATALAQWEGDCLSLNGLTKLSQETYAALDQSKAFGLNLDGLKQVVP